MMAVAKAGADDDDDDCDAAAGGDDSDSGDDCQEDARLSLFFDLSVKTNVYSTGAQATFSSC